MKTSDLFIPTSQNGLANARVRVPAIPADAVDGGLILLVDARNHTIAETIGEWWLLLDPSDQRIGHMHSNIENAEYPVNERRATEVERYIANLLVASRRLDVVNLVRQKAVIDYRAEGRVHDEKLAATLAAMRAKTKTSS